MIFKKGRKLKATEGWIINGQNLEIVDNFNFFRGDDGKHRRLE